MKIIERNQTIDVAAAKQALCDYIDSFEGRSAFTLCLYRFTIRRFLEFNQRSVGQVNGSVVIDEDRVLHWMMRESADVTAKHAATKYRILSRFLGALKRAGLITSDPTAALRARFGKRGWTGIALALKSADHKEALEAVRTEPRFKSPLGAPMRAYLELKRSVGAKYRTEEGTLADFDRFLREESINSPHAVTQKTVHRWLGRMSCGPITLRHKVHLIARLFNHLLALGIVTHNPADFMLTTGKRIAYPSFRPYIFSKQEVAAILEEARKLPSYPQFPLRPQTCCMIITLLYALGLRLGEACHLHINDVDLDQATLFIRDTKFHKSRTVPFGPRLRKHLEEYLDVRRTVFPPLRADDSLFVALQRRSVGLNTIEHTFRKLIKKAGIAASPGRRQPRLHDLRHTFAVQRLLRWYREGAEVQSKLPLLSTFMGHIDLKSTQFYLDITGDLLEEANTRFFGRFGSSFHEEVR